MVARRVRCAGSNGKPYAGCLPENLLDISALVAKENADLGFVVDPDVDRLAIICEDGSMFGEEYTLVAVSDYILKHTPGSTVSNLSSTRALKDVSEKYGCSYYSSAVGEVNVVEAMKRMNAVIGGEGNVALHALSLIGFEGSRLHAFVHLFEQFPLSLLQGFLRDIDHDNLSAVRRKSLQEMKCYVRTDLAGADHTDLVDGITAERKRHFPSSLGELAG